MNRYGNKVRLYYYDASDGPRLMMFGPLDVDVRSLQALFRQLASTPGKSIRLDEQPFVVPLMRITLTSSGPMSRRSRMRPMGLRRCQGISGVAFDWVLTTDDWDDLAELIDGLIRAEKAGHQYLDTYPSEDAIVVVSKGEYGDEVLEL